MTNYQDYDLEAHLIETIHSQLMVDGITQCMQLGVLDSVRLLIYEHGKLDEDL